MDINLSLGKKESQIDKNVQMSHTGVQIDQGFYLYHDDEH